MPESTSQLFADSSSHYKNRLFESPPTAVFQTTDFGVSSAFGAGNTKIGFIMRITVKPLQGLLFNPQKCDNTSVDWYYRMAVR